MNKEEFFLGTAWAAVWFAFAFPLFGWTWLAVAAGSGALWALGGSKLKAARRFGCAAVGLLCWQLHPLAGLVSYVACVAILSMGYGIPSTQPIDEGSTLGRFFFKLLRSEAQADAATRYTIFTLLSLAMLPLARINPLHYVLAAASFPVVGWFIVFSVEGEW